MKTFVVLVSVAIHINVLHAETVDEFIAGREIIIENSQDCRVAANFRKVFDDFHNGLRQKIAGGIPVNYQHFQKRLMYGLIYDCSLEMKAAQEARNPGTYRGFGIVNITREYDRSVLKAVQEGLEALITDRSNIRALFQIIYPKSTRFGCSGTLKRINGKRYTTLICLYDKKAVSSSFITKGACTKNEDCTYYKGSECKWHLCYAMGEH